MGRVGIVLLACSSALLGCGDSVANSASTRARVEGVESEGVERAGVQEDDGVASAAPELRSVGIDIRPADGGQAFFTVQRSGEASGGHMSGGDPPFVHERTETLSEEATAAIFAAAAAVVSPPLPEPGVEPGSGTSSIRVVVGDVVHQFHWSQGGRHPDPRVAALDALLREHAVGW